MHACLILPGVSAGLLGGSGFRSRPTALTTVCEFTGAMSQVLCVRKPKTPRVIDLIESETGVHVSRLLCDGGVMVYI